MKRVVAALVVIVGPVQGQDAGEVFRVGSERFAARDAAGAIAAFGEAVALRPGDAAAWKALGVVYASQGNYEEAEKPFRTACGFAPRLPDACFYYGRTLYLLNRFAAAITVLRAGQLNSRSYRIMGLSHEALGAAGDAEAAFQKALSMDGGSVPDEDPGIDYGVFLFRQGKAAEAMGPLLAALKRHPDSARGHLEAGCVLLALDRLEDAQGQLEQALSIDNGSARAHLLLAKVYLRQGKTAAAEPHLRQGSETVK